MSEKAIDRDGVVIASVSGGKDSAAMCLHLREHAIPYQAIFADTGWEHPDTYQYIREVLEPRIGPITWLRSERGGMVEWIRHKAMFPSRQARWCTDELKIVPIRKHFRQLIDAGHGPITNAVGIRAAESRSRAVLQEREHWHGDARGDLPIEVWRPLLQWTEQQVIDIHRRHNLRPNPLYLRGAKRIGCWPCIYARKDEISLLSRIDVATVNKIRDLEAEVTALARDRARRRSMTAFPVDLTDAELIAVEAELRDPQSTRHERHFFSASDPRPEASKIDRIVEWAHTARGGKQMMMYLDNNPSGCMRWGLCDVGDGWLP